MLPELDVASKLGFSRELQIQSHRIKEAILSLLTVAV